MLPRTDVPIGPTAGNKKMESLPKPARTRAKVPRKELYADENACTGSAQVPAPKQSSKIPSSLASKPLAERALRPVSVNIPAPVRLSPPRKSRANRLRSGSESKIQSLRPVDDPSDSCRQPSTDSLKPCALNKLHFAEPPSDPAETCRLSSRNLHTLSNLLQSNQPSLGPGELRMLETGERDPLLKPSEEGISEKYYSLAPTIGSSQRSGCSDGSLVTEPTLSRSAFFNAGIILPGPPCGVGRATPDSLLAEKPDHGPDSAAPARLALIRLETMVLKQRRVEFEPLEIHSKFDPSSENDDPLGRSGVPGVSNQSNNSLARKTLPSGRVRCALLESERLLGINWIHNVDTAMTSNPHITPQVRYHASMLFSLYWGSRSPKVPKHAVLPTSQPKAASDLSLDREAKKKLKLIAATAMACLTLTIKWHFDFCKPLCTLQLRSFCQTTDFITFKVTPQDLIVAERAILFSYPVAGGLWLDSPHAFLEELIHIVPPLRLLSSVPSYLRLQRSKEDSENWNAGLSESEDGQVPRTGVRWDWPKVVHQVERTLAKATMWQEVLAFEPSVLCVVALYISLDGVEAGYHERIDETRIVPDRVDGSEASGQVGGETGASAQVGEKTGLTVSELKSVAKGEETVSIPPPGVNDTGGPWIWRWIDINDTMDQVCRVTHVSGDDVENCLDWFCQSDPF